MNGFVLTPEVLAGFAGVVLSLFFSYIPGLSVKFAALLPEVKRAIMAGLLLIVSAGIWGLGCAGIVDAGLICDKSGLVQLAWIFVTSIIANQGTYSITPQTNAVKAVK